MITQLNLRLQIGFQHNPSKLRKYLLQNLNGKSKVTEPDTGYVTKNS